MAVITSIRLRNRGKALRWDQPIYEELQELDSGTMDLRIGLIAAFWHAQGCVNQHLATKATANTISG